MPSVCGAACGQASGKQGEAARALTSGPAIKKYAEMVEPAMFHGEKSRHLSDVGKRGKSLTSHTQIIELALTPAPCPEQEPTDSTQTETAFHKHGGTMAAFALVVSVGPESLHRALGRVYDLADREAGFLDPVQKMQVVAEFVENATIQACLEKMNVGWLQGYHIGKPTPLFTLESQGASS